MPVWNIEREKSKYSFTNSPNNGSKTQLLIQMKFEIWKNSTYQALPNTSASWSQRRSSSNTYCHLPWWNLTSISPPHPTPQHGPSPRSTSYWRRTPTLAQAYNTIWSMELLHMVEYQPTDNSISGIKDSVRTSVVKFYHQSNGMSTLKSSQLQRSKLKKKTSSNLLTSQPHCKIWA